MGTLIFLWMEISLSVQLSVIMGSGMKKEFLSLFEINECTVLLLVIFDKE